MMIVTNDDQRWIAKASGLSVRRVRRWCAFCKVYRRDRKALAKGVKAFQDTERGKAAVEEYYKLHPEQRYIDIDRGMLAAYYYMVHSIGASSGASP